MTDVVIIEGEQGTAEWRAMKVGVPSASHFSDIMAQGDGKMRDLYLRKVAGEIISGEPATEFQSAAMRRGNAVEPELRATFAIETGLPLRQVAFVRRAMQFGVIGASPDSLIGDDEGLEIKSEEPHLLIATLRSNKVPGKHLAQVQGSMLVSGRSAWWVAIGFPGMPLFKRRVPRDTAYCARLEVGLKAFQEELDELVAWLRRYGK